MATTRIEKRESKAESTAFIINVIRSRRTPLSLNTLHEQFKDVWPSRQMFIADIKAAAPADIEIVSRRRTGTLAGLAGTLPNFTANLDAVNVETPVKIAIMGGLQACNYEGRKTTKRPDRTMCSLAKWPKMFDKFPETTGVYRIDLTGVPSQYLQVTENGNYLFKRV